MIFSGEDRRKVRYEKAKTEDTYEKSKIDPHGMYLPYTVKLTYQQGFPIFLLRHIFFSLRI